MNKNVAIVGSRGAVGKEMREILIQRKFPIGEIRFFGSSNSGENEISFGGKKYPVRVGSHLMSDFTLPRKVFSGSDMILIPSKYEPGGIIAIEALRYGCIPIVRATGGLADSVVDYDPKSGQGYGFTFKNFVPEGLLTAVVRAIETHKNMPLWQKIVKRAMSADFSWKKSAEKYLDLYRRALQVRKESLQPNPSPASRPLYS